MGKTDDNPRQLEPFVTEPGTAEYATEPSVTEPTPRTHPLIPMQMLINAGLNAFAAELLAESLVMHQAPIEVKFMLRARKGKAFDAVAFTLTPVKLEDVRGRAEGHNAGESRDG